MATVATNAALTAAMASSPYTLVGAAMVGSAIENVEDSQLIGLLVSGEEPILAAGGEDGAVLFTSTRVIVAEQSGIISKRLAVKAFRRDAIVSYAIDPDKLVNLTLFGAFGQVSLYFETSFDPMLLSQWLGETLGSN